MSSQMKKCIERGLEEFQAQELLSSWNWGVFPHPMYLQNQLKWFYLVKQHTELIFRENRPKPQVMQLKITLTSSRTWNQSLHLDIHTHGTKGLGHNWSMNKETLSEAKGHCPRRCSFTISGQVPRSFKKNLPNYHFHRSAPHNPLKTFHLV